MSSISYMSNKKMSIGSYYPRSARTLPGLPSAANIPLPFIVADYSSGPCHSWLLCQADHHRAVPPKLGHDGVALGKLGRIGPRQPPLDLGGVEPPRRRHDASKRPVRQKC